MNDLRFRDVRPEAPLGEHDYAEIRRAVIDATKRREGSAIFLRMRIAAAAIVLASAFVSALLFIRPRPVPHAIPAAAPALRVQQSPPPAIAAPPAPQPAAVAEMPRPVRNTKHHKPALVAHADRAPVVIQLQTSNPDIQILWIAQ